MKEGKFKEACAAFSQSQKLDAQNGTLYNLAGCYMKVGKLATAWAAYHELAKSDSNLKRRADAARREKELEPRLSKLVIEADAELAGLAITLDGLDVTGLVNSPSPVDLGTYQIDATATGHPALHLTAKVVDERKTVKVKLAFAEAPESGTGHEPVAEKPRRTIKPRQSVEPATHATRDDQPIDDPSPPRSRRRTYAVVTIAGGVALVGTGLVFGRLASQKWDEAKAVCGGTTCTKLSELARGNALADTARSRANLATGLVLGGGVALAIGTVLYLKAPARIDARTAIRVSPGSGTALAGLTLDGRF
jgi:hypothetical protein